jgi:hypothetical protein
MGDAEIQRQRHRTHRIREVTSQFDVPTLRTPVPSHLCVFTWWVVRKMSAIASTVSLLGTRVGGTSAEVVPERINLKLPATTSQERPQ